MPVPDLAATTAAGLARRLSAGQWPTVETGLGDVAAAALELLPAERAAALCEQVTIDASIRIKGCWEHSSVVRSRLWDHRGSSPTMRPCRSMDRRSPSPRARSTSYCRWGSPLTPTQSRSSQFTGA